MLKCRSTREQLASMQLARINHGALPVRRACLAGARPAPRGLRSVLRAVEQKDSTPPLMMSGERKVKMLISKCGLPESSRGRGQHGALERGALSLAHTRQPLASRAQAV